MIKQVSARFPEGYFLTYLYNFVSSSSRSSGAPDLGGSATDLPQQEAGLAGNGSTAFSCSEGPAIVGSVVPVSIGTESGGSSGWAQDTHGVQLAFVLGHTQETRSRSGYYVIWATLLVITLPCHTAHRSSGLRLLCGRNTGSSFIQPEYHTMYHQVPPRCHSFLYGEACNLYVLAGLMAKYKSTSLLDSGWGCIKNFVAPRSASG
jgi:hypothetical protein